MLLKHKLDPVFLLILLTYADVEVSLELQCGHPCEPFLILRDETAMIWSSNFELQSLKKMLHGYTNQQVLILNPNSVTPYNAERAVSVRCPSLSRALAFIILCRC